MSQITVTSAFALLTQAGYKPLDAAGALTDAGFDAAEVLRLVLGLPTTAAPAPAKKAPAKKAARKAAPAKALKACKRAGCTTSVASTRHALCAQHSKESADRGAMFVGARQAAREAQSATGVSNSDLAAALRAAGIKPNGDPWKAAKAALAQGVPAAVEAARKVA